MPHRRTDVSKDKGDLSPICFARVAWQRGASISARILRFFLGRRPSELRQDSFDAKFGTDTERSEVLVHLSIQSPNYVHGMRYEASSADTCERTIASLEIEFPRFTFVDLGCGKGRPLIIAAQHGFLKVVGVEFARELVERCHENIAKTRIGNAEVLHLDVCDYRFPLTPLVVYMFNPFDAKIMARVLQNLRGSYEQFPRSIRIIYVHTGNPEIFALFRNESWLKPVSEEKGVRLYRSVTE
jgi:SAM-dependent methyltransferase